MNFILVDELASLLYDKFQLNLITNKIKNTKTIILNNFFKLQNNEEEDMTSIITNKLNKMINTADNFNILNFCKTNLYFIYLFFYLIFLSIFNFLIEIYQEYNFLNFIYENFTKKKLIIFMIIIYHFSFGIIVLQFIYQKPKPLQQTTLQNSLQNYIPPSLLTCDYNNIKSCPINKYFLSNNIKNYLTYKYKYFIQRQENLKQFIQSTINLFKLIFKFVFIYLLFISIILIIRWCTLDDQNNTFIYNNNNQNNNQMVGYGLNYGMVATGMNGVVETGMLFVPKYDTVVVDNNNGGNGFTNHGNGGIGGGKRELRKFVFGEGVVEEHVRKIKCNLSP
ncbi:hypothetical protein ABK040_000062 [Willaertia magna]